MNADSAQDTMRHRRTVLCYPTTSAWFECVVSRLESLFYIVINKYKIMPEINFY